MSKQREADVLVAGAGPVGLFAALVLARRGVSVEVVDESWRETARSYALALHPGTLGLLGDERLLDAILARAQRLDAAAFYDRAERGQVLSFGMLSAPFPFVAVLPQHDLETLLVERLKALQVEVQWNHRVAALEPAGDALAVRVQRLGKASSGYAVAHSGWVVDAETVKHPRYVVGADGHDSLVRRHIGIDLQRTDEPSLYAVFEMAGHVPLERELRIVLGERTTDVLWPLPGNRCRWSFELEDDQELRIWREKSRMAFSLGERAFPHLGPGAFGELVRERAPWFPLDKVADTAWSVLVRFERSLATRFGSGRAWLCGDAAHLAGPLAVRSMNVGLREARDLADRLANGLRGADTPALLEAYERERLAEWRGLLELERGATGARKSERILACLPASGAELEQFRSLPALQA